MCASRDSNRCPPLTKPWCRPPSQKCSRGIWHGAPSSGTSRGHLSTSTSTRCGCSPVRGCELGSLGSPQGSWSQDPLDKACNKIVRYQDNRQINRLRSALSISNRIALERYLYLIG